MCSISSAKVVDFADSLKLKNLSLTVNALTAATDVVIAAILCFLLQKSRTGFRRSDTMITKLVRLLSPRCPRAVSFLRGPPADVLALRARVRHRLSSL